MARWLEQWTGSPWRVGSNPGKDGLSRYNLTKYGTMDKLLNSLIKPCSTVYQYLYKCGCMQLCNLGVVVCYTGVSLQSHMWSIGHHTYGCIHLGDCMLPWGWVSPQSHMWSIGHHKCVIPLTHCTIVGESIYCKARVRPYFLTHLSLEGPGLALLQTNCNHLW